eukprot:CAMPEP_0194329934 /NCGR_PEP_ID=MMETSP0171-20130528/49846_1 /TAXON_ID=218684 /ORGANISM="Corethron pennatum, Strain L29A3" /LENGTH=529 /DNA_ID=CAMNT_0039090817 /DNA_START=141 /DNA_END=1730 /DNA_ORIENTATION=-
MDRYARNLFSSSADANSVQDENHPNCGMAGLRQLENQKLLSLNSIRPNYSKHMSEYNLFDVNSPGCGETVGRLHSMDREDVVKAIGYSSDSLSSWRSTTGSYRSTIISSWSNLVKDNVGDIAKIMTMESGKPIRESTGEVLYGASFLDFYAAEAVRPSSSGGGYIIPTPFHEVFDGKTARGKVMAVKEAVGVTAMITPWNFPFAMIARKVGPALAAGCTAIVKPSELTPLTAVAIHNLALQAGVPSGVLQLIIADKGTTKYVGEELCENPIVKKLSFTGSTSVGKLLMKDCSKSVKRLSLELGGNAAFIVFDDADVEVAVAAAMSSKYRNAGQTCICSDRFIIHRSIEDSFLKRLKEEVKKLVIGHGISEETTMGPMITSEAVSNVSQKVEEAIVDGAEVICGGKKMSHLGSNFYEPTILRKVRSSSRIWMEETFGPVASICTFEDEEDAITMANDTPSGLAVYFCSENFKRIFRVAGRLENGMVGINDGIIITAHCPFGGIKESGLGREGSSEGMAEYLETKHIFLNM